MTAVIRPALRALERVDHDQQFHDRLVDRVGRRLDEEDVLLADVVEDLDEDVLVRELEDLGLAGLRAEVAADLPGQVRVGVAVVDLELVRVQPRRLPLAEVRGRRVTDRRTGRVCRDRPLRGPSSSPMPSRLCKSGPEGGDRDDPVALREPHDDHAACAATSSG